MLDQITPLVLTHDEAPNIARTIDKLGWARRIVVIDSGSTDGTLELLRLYPKVDVIHHKFGDFASQCNFGLTRIASPWVLSLDADYELSPELVREMSTLAPQDRVAGYHARFVYRIHGRRLHGSLYPSRTVLYRTEKAVYHLRGHAHRVIVDGDILPLAGVIYHDDRKPLARWLASQRRYARDEADYLLGSHDAPLRRSDKVRLLGWAAPLGVLLYVLLFKGCIIDGWPGWYYALQRLLAETLISLELLDRRLRANAVGHGDDAGPRR